MDVAPVLGGEPGEVEQLDLDVRRASSTSRAISASRQLFDISPGQVCSLRDEALIEQHARRPGGRRGAPRPASIASRAAIQSTERS